MKPKPEKEIEKETREFKWYLDKILMLAAAGFVIAGIAIWVISDKNDNTAMMFVGVAMLPGTGILITPNVVLSAIKDNKDWRRKFPRRHMIEEAALKEVEDPSPYHEKLASAVIWEAVLNFGFLIIAAAVMIVLTFILGDGSDKAVVGGFFLFVGIMVFGLPIISYNAACSAYRIRTVLRREYLSYRAVVLRADNYNIRIAGNTRTFKLKNCRCLGIREKNAEDTKSILFFVPDEIFLIPDEE